MRIHHFLPLLLFIGVTGKSQTQPPSAGTIILQKQNEGEENQIKREQWLEQMHQASPGADWREMDRNNRWQKYLQNKQNWNKNTNQVMAGPVTGTWKERGSNNLAGRIHVSVLDNVNNLLYCASAGGTVWRGNSDGTNWTPLNDAIRFESILRMHILPSPSSGQRLLVTTNRALFFSDDGGSSWNKATGLTGAWTNKSIVTANNTIYLLADKWYNTYGGTVLYRSTDKGSSFVEVTNYPEPTYGPSGGFDLFAPYTGSDTVFMLQKNNCYYLNPVTGMPVLRSQLPLLSNGLAMLCGSKTTTSTYLYAYVNQELYRSTNSGKNWNYVVKLPTGPFMGINNFNASIANPSHLFLGGMEAWRSYDGGATWTVVNGWGEYYGNMAAKLHADIPSIIPCLDNNGNERQYITCDGGLYVSADNLASVTNLSLQGLNTSQYYSTYTHPMDSFIWAGAQDQGLQKCENTSGMTLDFNQVVSGDWGNIVSSDGGKSIWTVYPGILIGPSAWWWFSGNAVIPQWLAPLMADPSKNPKIAYMGGGYLTGSSGSHILKLTDATSTTPIIASQLTYDFKAASGGGNISTLAYSPINPNYWYVLTSNGRFFYSTDFGNTWTKSSFSSFCASAIYPSKTQLGTVYIGGSGYSNAPVYKTTDGGQSFTSMSTGLPSTMVYQLTGNTGGDMLFAATELGAYIYVASENKWYDLSGGSAPDQTYTSVEYIAMNNTVRFGTYGRGIWDFRVLPMPPGISVSPSAVICRGSSVTLTASGTSTYSWSPGGQTTESIIVNPVTNITYTLTGSNGGTATQMIAVNAPSTPTITQNGNVLTSSAVTGNQWYRYGIIITGATSQNYTITQNGFYNVSVANVNGCSSASMSLFYNIGGTCCAYDLNGDGLVGLADVLMFIPYFNKLVADHPALVSYDLNGDGLVGLADVLMFIPCFNKLCVPGSPPIEEYRQTGDDEPLLSIHPNPNNGMMTFNYYLPIAGTLEFYDITGKKILSYDLTEKTTSLAISQSRLNAGVYMYRVIIENMVIVQDKLVIIK